MFEIFSTALFLENIIFSKLYNAERELDEQRNAQIISGKKK